MSLADSRLWRPHSRNSSAEFRRLASRGGRRLAAQKPLPENEPKAKVPALLEMLPPEPRRFLTARIERRTVAAETILARKDAPCNELWFVERGLIDVDFSPECEESLAASHPILRAGDYYGGHSATEDARHGAQLVALGETEIASLPTGALREAAERWPETQRWVERVIGCRATASLGVRLMGARGDGQAVARLIDNLEPEWLSAGDSVLSTGESVAALRLIVAGSATVLAAGLEGRTRTVGPGGLLGAAALLMCVSSHESIVAASDLQLLSIRRESLEDVFAAHPHLREALAEVALSEARTPAADPAIDRSPASEASPPAEMELDDSPRQPRWWERKRFFGQLRENDCGAACLQMIHAYHGCELSQSGARNIARVSRYGTSLWDLREAGERLGYLASAVEVNDWDSLRRMNLPAIAHVDKNHFLVVWRVGRRSVTVGDPASGRERIPKTEFLKRFSGILLLLRPTGALGESIAGDAAGAEGVDEKQPSVLKRLWPFVRPHRGILAQVLLASMLLQVFGVVAPLLTQVIIDRVIGHHEIGLLNVLFGAIVGLAACETVVRFSRNYLLVHASTQLERSVLEAVYRHVLSLAQSFFSRFTTGDLVRRFGEVNDIKNFLTENAVAVLLDLMTVTSYSALMLYMQPRLTGWYLGVLVASAAVMLVLVRPVRGHVQNFMRKFAGLNAQVIDSFKGIEPVKAMALEAPFGKWFARLLTPALVHSRAAANWSANAGLAVQFLTAVNSALLLWLGAGMIVGGEMSLGQLVALLMLSQQLTGPFLRLLQHWSEFQRTAVSLSRVGDLLGETPEIKSHERRGANLSPRALRGEIEFDEVCFRYEGDPKDADRPVIDSLSLKIAPGEVVGIVGRSGCGKSTIARLLLRFHEPTAGRILLDGVHLRDYDAQALRSHVGLVTQDAFLYGASIKDNIACGREEVSEQDLIRAAQAAGAYEFISRLPYGFETLVGEQGLRLSGGQAQRIAIARALCNNPRLLIFDEATAALDPLIEQEIHERLREVIRGRTTLIIAHRLHTLRKADRIIVLDRGRLVEQGSHDELIARKGLYERMFTASPDWSGAKG